jgi:hypothetical protein
MYVYCVHIFEQREPRDATKGSVPCRACRPLQSTKARTDAPMIWRYGMWVIHTASAARLPPLACVR